MSDTQIAAMAAQVPAEAQTVMLPGSMSPAMLIMLNEPLFRRVTAIAKMMARTSGVIPKHLYDKEGACFAIVTRSMTWKLDPWAVAPCTYETPNGGVGFEGKLCHAALENSGELEGGLSYEHYHGVWVKYPNGLEERFRSNDPVLMLALGSPDEQFPDPVIPGLKVKGRGGQVVKQNSWDALIGKYKIQTSSKGKPYPVADWPKDAEIGLGVTIRAQLKGEVKPREHHLDLVQAYPRNSTLWPTDPRTQICYLGARRFANLRVPHLFMGLSFDREDLEAIAIGPMGARDITPEDRQARPQRGQQPPPENDVEDVIDLKLSLTSNDGGEREFEDLDVFADEFVAALKQLAEAGDRAGLQAYWDRNSACFGTLRQFQGIGTETVDGLTKAFQELEAEVTQHEAEQRKAQQQSSTETGKTVTPPSTQKPPASTKAAETPKADTVAKPWIFKPIGGREKPVEMSSAREFAEAMLKTIKEQGYAPSPVSTFAFMLNRPSMDRLDKTEPELYQTIIDACRAAGCDC